MLTLKELQLKNFLSHELTKVEFKESQKLLIDGKSGAGKSSIIDALIWVFYGEGRSDNRNLIRNGRHEAEVQVVLTEGEEQIKIARTINEKGKHDLKISTKSGARWKPIEVTGLKNLQEHLETKILRSSYSLFINSIAYPQDNTDNFVRQTAAKRKDILLEIVRASQYDELYVKTREKITELQLAIASSVAEKAILENEIPLLKERAEKLGELIVEEHGLTSYIKTLQDKVAEFEKQSTQIWALDSEKRLLITEVGTIKTAELNEEIKAINSKLISKPENLQPKIDELQKQLSVNSGQLKFLRSEQDRANEWNKKMLLIERNRPMDEHIQANIEQVNAELIKLTSKPIPSCRKCGEPYSEYKEEKDNRQKTLETQLTNLLENKIQYDKRLAEYQMAIANLGQCPIIDTIGIKVLERGTEEDSATLAALVKKQSESAVDVKLLEAELVRKTDEYNKLYARLMEISERISVINKQLGELQVVMENLEKAKMELKEVQVKLMAIQVEKKSAEEAAIQLKTAEEKLAAVQLLTQKSSTDIENLKLLKDAFGPNGVKALIIDYIIPRLEDKINNVLSQLSDFRVRLDTQKSTIDGESTIEGLFINIINDQGLEFEFNNYSGGEKLKIVVAISEALSEVQNIGFRILDELFTALDAEATEKFAKVMNTLQGRFNQLLCITHLQPIKDLFQEKIEVKKLNGISIIN